MGVLEKERTPYSLFFFLSAPKSLYQKGVKNLACILHGFIYFWLTDSVCCINGVIPYLHSMKEN